MKFLSDLLIKLIIPVSYLLVMVSCKEKDNTAPKPIPQNCQVTKIVQGNEQTVTVTYGNKKRVASIIYDYANQVDDQEIYEYDAADNVIKITHKNPATNEIYSYSTYTYNNAGLVEKESVYDYWGIEGAEYMHLYDALMEYNDKKQLIKATYTSPNKPDEISNYQTFAYDAAGNVTREESYIDGFPNNGLYRISVYAYDDNKNSKFGNYYSEINAFNLSKNNVLSETNTIYYPTTSEKVINHIYTYTEAKFPLTETITGNGQNVQRTFEYQCED